MLYHKLPKEGRSSLAYVSMSLWLKLEPHHGITFALTPNLKPAKIELTTVRASESTVSRIACASGPWKYRTRNRSPPFRYQLWIQVAEDLLGEKKGRSVKLFALAGGDITGKRGKATLKVYALSNKLPQFGNTASDSLTLSHGGGSNAFIR